MDAREWLDYIADGKLSSVWALSEKLAWEKAQSEVVSCREEFSQLLDRLSGTSNRLGRGLRCVCCAIAQGCRLGAIEVVSENAPILLHGRRRQRKWSGLGRSKTVHSGMSLMDSLNLPLRRNTCEQKAERLNYTPP